MEDKSMKGSMKKDAQRAAAKLDVHDFTYGSFDGVTYVIQGNLPEKWEKITENGGQMESTVCYRPDGTLYGRKSPDGSATYYFPDGKTVMVSEDKDGNRICYQQDGRISYTEGKGVMTFYDAEGKKPKFQVTDTCITDISSGQEFKNFRQYEEYRSMLPSKHKIDQNNGSAHVVDQNKGSTHKIDPKMVQVSILKHRLSQIQHG